MARNPSRRASLADAGISVLAREGARGLTHRAVDAEAGVPAGTTSNYFRSRALLLDALVARIGERLAPDPLVHAELSERAPTKDLFAEYLRDIVRRLSTQRDVTLALFELRLESARRPEVAEAIGTWLRTGFDGDVAFNTGARLPGGREEIALFHYAIDGLLLDRLTTPIDPATPTDAVVEALAARLLPPAS
ncbi:MULTISPECIES: TetR/AcrR family transcriptional regulator [Microbacterium]|uniref:TetR/AcrR family transcriptional regulator n=1 Tax=Microbacterium wangchenii TaxID=2541726 RepID=A0ABX5SWG3_9MICO|nr:MULTISPECIES: TetR/AcrR family transcriptional regulator [Microbacterium]MCK6066223.1 TetR family transcriptional regulator [Microbacterium sp. EYE_512]QBR90494.1 TetR/AcrR family transcriptional regulator [Microbacterium wangchenii]TFV84698.1 TetR/AcrR family transcriptional regulator [Microbacterium sp. dk485]TXK14520.1 TetR/AcrR family transcriptional regulator [Microbacterium wangchenii]